MARRLALPIGLKGRASLWGDGVDDVVIGTNPLAGAVASTLAAWVRCRGSSGTLQFVLQTGNSLAGQSIFLGVIDAGGLPHFGCGLYATTNIADPGVMPAGWHRIVRTHAGGTASEQLYVDGELRATGPATTPAIAGTDAYLLRRNNAVLYPFRGNISDARIYSRAWTPAEVAADARGEWVDSTGLVRRWTCENPGYGATCHEEIGNTDDTITGALWSPDVPFRRRRIVEDVAAAPYSTVTIANATAFDPDAGDFGAMGWFSIGESAATPMVISKKGLNNVDPGWRIVRYLNRIFAQAADNNGHFVGGWVDRGTYDSLFAWHHVAMVIDRGAAQLRVFVDAQRPVVFSLATFDTGISNALDLTLSGGATNAAGARNDWLTRKGAVFTWEEIEAHYYDGVTPTPPVGSVQVGWAMREGAGLVAASTPAGYNGTLSAANWSTETRCKARVIA